MSGVIKISITLLNGAQVSLETEDREIVRELLNSVLPPLSGPALDGIHPVETSGNGAVAVPAATNGSMTRPTVADQNSESPPAAVSPAGQDGPPAPPVTTFPKASILLADLASSRAAAQNGPAPAVPTGTTAPAPEKPLRVEPATPSEWEYVAFCQRVSPLGDMRRVVVAAEAADRFLAVKSVDPDELARLFTLAGWPPPHNFVQTLRNAARTKFRWLERIPGQSGHYRVTNTGRSIVLGENYAPEPASVFPA